MTVTSLFFIFREYKISKNNSENVTYISSYYFISLRHKKRKSKVLPNQKNYRAEY